MAERRMASCRFKSGSVLMEYVVLLVFVGVVLMVASVKLFYGYDEDEGRMSYGAMGRQFRNFCQRTMGGIALPVP